MGQAQREETYLGDGVYASWDGWHIWLRTRRGGHDERIALEPNVYGALMEYGKGDRDTREVDR